MASTVSAANIKTAMKNAIALVDVYSGPVTNDEILLALATAIANEVNATIVATFDTHKAFMDTHVHTSPAGGSTGGPSAPPPE